MPRAPGQKNAPKRLLPVPEPSRTLAEQQTYASCAEQHASKKTVTFTRPRKVTIEPKVDKLEEIDAKTRNENYKKKLQAIVVEPLKDEIWSPYNQLIPMVEAITKKLQQHDQYFLELASSIEHLQNSLREYATNRSTKPIYADDYEDVGVQAYFAPDLDDAATQMHPDDMPDTRQRGRPSKDPARYWGLLP